MRSLRYLFQNFRQRIESELVLTRMGELALRDLNLLTRGLIYNLGSSIDAVIIEGLETSLNAGFLIDIAIPAVVVQNVGDGVNTSDVSVVTDENLDNSGVDYQITITTPDGANDRIDIIQAQIKQRSAFTDLAVDLVDPITQVVTPTTLDRDKEVYLDVALVTGTPAGSPTPPSTTAAAAGTFVGTVTTDNLDLTTEYILYLAVGKDAEFIEIDMRGGTPAATTRTERINAINAAGFGTVATNDGGAIRITAPGVGENSVIQVKSPLLSAKDAYTLVFGVTTSLGYLDTYLGTNAWFKISEIFVPAAAGSLVPANIRSREDKDADWDSDAATIENAYSFDGHRKSVPLDHADDSIFPNHLDPSVTASIQNKTTIFRGANAPIYNVVGDGTFRKGTIFLEDIACVTAAGVAQADTETEQEFPVNRVDQFQETTGGGTYPVPTALNEPDKTIFTPGTAITAGGNYYTVVNFAGNHNRVGVYITNGAACLNFTHMRITMHNSGDASQGTADITIADLQSVNVGWIYVNFSVSITAGLPYHYHFSLVGASSETRPVLGTDGSTNIAFREMYLPDSGIYGSASENDIIKLLSNDGTRLIPDRAAAEDAISSPGDGYIGATGLDIIVEDFSNTTYWTNWIYNSYIGVDLGLGRIKFPSGQTVDLIYGEFNVNEGINESDTKNYLRHITERSLEESLQSLEEGFVEFEISDIFPDTTTNIFESVVSNSWAVTFPGTLTPLGEFNYSARNAGLYHRNDMFFRLFYSMSAGDTGVVKLDFEIYVDGSLLATRSITIDPPNDTSRSSELTSTSNVYIAGAEFTKGNDIRIKISRDNGVGSNHTDDFQLLGLTVI